LMIQTSSSWKLPQAEYRKQRKPRGKDSVLIDTPLKSKADNCDYLTSYRLCVFASGSLITVIFSSRKLIKVSCLHLGQNRGKFSSTVSSRILLRVLLSHTGHISHSILQMTSTPLNHRFIYLTSTSIISPSLFRLMVISPTPLSY
jgi:hypothetical protein